MPDDTTIKGPADRKKVNINQSYEILYWTTKWGVSAADLINAVKTVGPLVKDVEKFLKV